MPLWASVGHFPWTLIIISEIQRLGPDEKYQVSVMMRSAREENLATCNNMDESGGR